MKTNTALPSVRRSSATSEVAPGRASSHHEVEQPLIRGVTPHPSDPPAPGEKPRIEHSLDWLTYTVPFKVGIEKAFLPHEALDLTGEVLSNIRGYNKRIGLTYGSVSFHTAHPEYKICVQLRGKDLRDARAAGVDISDLLAYALSLRGVITRLDFAVDYYGPSSPMDLHEAWERKVMKAPTQRHRFVYDCERVKGEDQEAYTAYLGSKASQRWLRCYDKAAQLKVAGPWTRIELVAQKGYGNRLAQAMLREGIGEAGKQAIREYVTCDIGWFNEALTGLSVYIEPSHREDHNTVQWLFSQVLPALARVLEEEALRGKTEVRDAFLTTLQVAGKYRKAA